MRYALEFSRIVLSLNFFGNERDYSLFLAYRKHPMLESKVVAGEQIVANVRPKVTVEFSWQTITARGFSILKIFEHI